jgi:hypothetical protein
MKKQILILLSVISFLAACKPVSKNPNKSSMGNTPHIEDEKEKENNSVDRVKSVADFESNWAKWENHSQDLIKDVTGDGLADTVTMRLHLTESEHYSIIAGIRTHGRLAYADTLLVDKGYD